MFWPGSRGRSASEAWSQATEREGIFDRAFDLLRRGCTERHSATRTTLLIDAAAIAFLSLIPLRNADTVIRWGEHLSHDDKAMADWIYRMPDLS